MADFDVNTITAAGATLIASATAGNKLVIDGCDATTDVLTKAQAVQVSTRPATPGSNTTEVALAGSTDNHVYAYAEFIRGQSTGGDFNTFYLYGHIQNTPSVVRVIAIASASSPTHLPASGDVTNRTELQFELTFSATDEVVTVADSSMYTTRGEFLLLKERTVTTHAEGTPTTGEAQTIYGNKSFADGLSLSTLSGISTNPITLTSSIIPQDYSAKLGSIGTQFSEIFVNHITGPSDLDHGIYIQTDYEYGQAGQLYDSGWRTEIDHKKFNTKLYMNAYDNNGTETLENAGIRLTYNGATKASIELSYDKTNDVSMIELIGGSIRFSDGTNSATWSITWNSVAISTAEFVVGSGLNSRIQVNKICLTNDPDDGVGLIYWDDVNYVFRTDRSILPQYSVEIDLGGQGYWWNDIYVNRLRLPNGDIYYNDDTDALTVNASFSSNEDGYYNLGAPAYPWDNVYANKFHGVIPSPSAQYLDEPEIGSIFFAGITVSGAVTVNAGATAKVGSPLSSGGANVTAIGTVMWDTTNAKFTSLAPFSTSTGTYKLLCGVSKLSTDTNCYALVIRVS